MNLQKSPSSVLRRIVDRRKRLKIVAIVSVILMALIGGYLLISRYLADRNVSGAEKVLSVADLEDASVDLSSRTPDSSVESLAKELKVKINKQIADKENPIETVRILVGVLCNTANAKRPTQCVDYVREFLDTKIDTLKLESDLYGKPEEAQINQWRAQFYADLAYGYQMIMNNKFTGPNGQPFDTTDEQFKYVNLYLEISQDPKNWGEAQTNEEDGRTWYFYDYPETQAFVEWREQLEAGGSQ